MDAKNKEEKLRFAIEFAKQAREHLEVIVESEIDGDLRMVLQKSIKELEVIRYGLRRVKAKYTAEAEEVEYTEDGLITDKLTSKIMAERRAAMLLAKIEAETRS